MITIRLRRAGSRITVAMAALSLLAGCASGAATPGAATPGAATPGAATPAPTAVSLQGKTLHVIINFSAGGPTDTFGRLFVKHLANLLPGKPTVVVENVPGGDGVIGSNKLWRSAPDGLTMGILTDPAPPQFLKDPAAEFDMAKWTWLAGIAEAEVFFVRTDLGVKTSEELAAKKPKVILGGYGPRSDVDLQMRIFLNALGVGYTYVTGYPGGADILAAFKRGETNAFLYSLAGYFPTVRPLIASGDVTPLAQSGLLSADGKIVADKRAGDLPVMIDVVRSIRPDKLTPEVESALRLLAGNLSILRTIVAPPGVPSDMATTLQTAIAGTFSDAAFQADSKKLLGFEVQSLSGQDAAKVAATLVDASASQGAQYLITLASNRDQR